VNHIQDIRGTSSAPLCETGNRICFPIQRRGQGSTSKSSGKFIDCAKRKIPETDQRGTEYGAKNGPSIDRKIALELYASSEDPAVHSFVKRLDSIHYFTLHSCRFHRIADFRDRYLDLNHGSYILSCNFCSLRSVSLWIRRIFQRFTFDDRWASPSFRKPLRCHVRCE
jgi:hypothetical protein